MQHEPSRSPSLTRTENGLVHRPRPVTSPAPGSLSPFQSSQQDSRPSLSDGQPYSPIEPRPSQAAQGSETTRVSKHQRRRRKGELNKFACFTCQRKKTKCDGARPLCGACVKRTRKDLDIECQYPVDNPGAVSRFSCLKDRYQQLQDLLKYLVSPSETEAFEVYRRLRSNPDPFTVLQQLRDADSLLAIPSLSGSGAAEGELQKMDADALAASIIRVPARPWTAVVGDGLVSSLISAYFKWDNPMFNFWIDRQLFVRDMRSVDPTTAQYCSRFLVNAICAFRIAFSAATEHLTRRRQTDLSARFLEEAKYHLEMEKDNPSLATMQGLYLMQLFCTSTLNSKSAMNYRTALISTLAGMRLEGEFARLRGQSLYETERRRAISKACWGVFCGESLFSHLALQPHGVTPPGIPCIFDYETDSAINIDIFGCPFGYGSPEPPIVGAVQPAKVQVCLLHYRVVQYNACPKGPVGGNEDMNARRAFFHELATLERALPPHVDYRTNLTPQTLNLRMFMNMVAYVIVRPLHVDTVVQPGHTARTILMDLCAVDTEMAERYFHRFGMREYTAAVMPGIWGVLLTVIPFLDDPVASSLFVRALHLLRMHYTNIPQFRGVMLGVLATASQLGVRIPEEALRYFGDLEHVNPSELNEAAPERTAYLAEREVKGLVALNVYIDESNPQREWGLVVARSR
ncbi:hypothetical protein VTK26DRAFT_2843 [Humicola hyalothermophila]